MYNIFIILYKPHEKTQTDNELILQMSIAHVPRYIFFISVKLQNHVPLLR